MKDLLPITSIWRQSNAVDINSKLATNKINDAIASIFAPGKYYYLIFNFFTFEFEQISSGIEEIMGCKPEEFNLEFLFEKMHPEDAKKYLLKENAAVEFFYRRIPPEKIPFYKSTYTFRIQDEKKGWKTILQQSIAIQLSANGRIHYVLCIHSDVTFLNVTPDDRISFVGVAGEPSYYALSTKPETILRPDEDFEISERECEIIALLANGLSSKQIAGQLFLSVHTVDTHRRNLLRKTGTKNTLELTAVCIRRGLV